MNPMMNHNGKEYFKKNVYVCVTESLSCPTRFSNIVNQPYFSKTKEKRGAHVASWTHPDPLCFQSGLRAQ